ncbi:HNH endonuclease [Chryseobacterium sp. ERMR1:04]|uniref:HNH endonuclease n=1 Tax=Chryseobacterium sp. ERMR1:04 TaxID=1705393 RepID=UPI0006C86ECD|nr:hypothetical protein [Chryseobacterium sp. ERMR1:04]KPH14462.1 hypothetical protein AMQ68_02985 [Chryseobacterium sp. ERMR1:04]
MLNLKSSDINALNYYNSIKHKIKKIDSLGLIKEDVKNLILSKPKDLIKLSSHLMPQIIPDFDFDEFLIYLKKKEKGRMKDIKYHSKILEIKDVFKYSQIVGNEYFLAKLLDQHTCVYCNRNYVKTIGDTQNKVLRADYDHFFSQSKYPLLALSFYNLIPVCSYCNSKKLDGHFQLDTHLHPYLMNADDKNFSFSFRKKNFIENNVKLNIITENAKSKIRIENTFKDLCLKEIYNAYSDKELRNLLDLRYKYSKNYLNILLNETFKELSISKEEVYRMIFGIEIKEDDYHKRPFSKFKHDIIEELKKTF